jgi:hypothetical protein
VSEVDLTKVSDSDEGTSEFDFGGYKVNDQLYYMIDDDPFPCRVARLSQTRGLMIRIANPTDGRWDPEIGRGRRHWPDSGTPFISINPIKHKVT